MRVGHTAVRQPFGFARDAPVMIVPTRRILLCALGTAFAPHIALAQPATPAAGRVLVMPFENVRHDSRIIWIGEAAAVLLADDLNAFGVSAITRDERRQAL